MQSLSQTLVEVEYIVFLYLIFSSWY